MARKAGVSAETAEQLLDAPAGDKSTGRASKSDAEMLEDIRHCLEQSPFDTSELRVHIQDGAVHIAGRVESEQARAGVLDIIGGCSGGLVTQDQLGVGR
jgi:osmotically-inducible protein OsmY